MEKINYAKKIVNAHAIRDVKLNIFIDRISFFFLFYEPIYIHSKQ